jgi:hypothetical protein
MAVPAAGKPPGLQLISMLLHPLPPASDMHPMAIMRECLEHLDGLHCSKKSVSGS